MLSITGSLETGRVTTTLSSGQTSIDVAVTVASGMDAAALQSAVITAINAARDGDGNQLVVASVGSADEFVILRSNSADTSFSAAVSIAGERYNKCVCFLCRRGDGGCGHSSEICKVIS